MPAVVFVLLALIAAVLYICIGGGTVWQAAIVFVVFFVALNLLYLIALCIMTLFINNKRPIDKQNTLCRLGCIGIASLLIDYSLVRPHISGLEKLPDKQRFLFVCNHRSMYDPLIVIDKLRRYNISFVSKPSSMQITVAGKIAYRSGFLPIDRENDRNALKTILQAADYLKRNLCSIAIYPEGTRSRTGDLLPFHAGSFKIAQKAGVPLVIAAVYGTEKVKNNLLRRVTDAYLDILEVIPAEQVKAMPTAELASYSRSIIEAHISAV